MDRTRVADAGLATLAVADSLPASANLSHGFAHLIRTFVGRTGLEPVTEEL